MKDTKMTNKTKHLFAGLQLPVLPAMAADGASIRVIQDPVAAMPGQMPFFGGYAEDMLADIGFDIVDEAPVASAKAKLA